MENIEVMEVLENKKVMGVLEEKFKDCKSSELEKSVIDIIIKECENEPINYISQALKYGCFEVFITPLDTKEFFIKNVDEIFELLEDYEERNEEKIDFQILNCNTLAWFGFDQIIYKLANELGIEK